MILKIEPIDSLFFRDAKPFTMGEDTWANSVFPPSPSVIYGAFRSLYFSENIDEFHNLKDKKNLNKDLDPTKKLKINSINLKIGDEIYFPIPFDCVKYKDNENELVYTLEFDDNLSKEGIKNSTLDRILISKAGKRVKDIHSGFVRKSAFEEYLKTNKPFTIQELSKIIIIEPKIGIAKSTETHSSEEGKLYRVEMIRLKKDIKFIVNFEDLNLPDKGLLKLGGEGKTVSYVKVQDNIDVKFPDFSENEKYFKLILSTPGIFDNGWLPSWIDEDKLDGEIEGLNIRLIAVTIGKPIYIGGFDMAIGRPKPMYKAVPAGSVYYFKLLNGTMNDVKEIFHQKAISDKYKKQGFAISYVGKVLNKGEL
jgi:CRISPR-associated protein Cmr3